MALFIIRNICFKQVVGPVLFMVIKLRVKFLEEVSIALLECVERHSYRLELVSPERVGIALDPKFVRAVWVNRNFVEKLPFRFIRLITTVATCARISCIARGQDLHTDRCVSFEPVFGFIIKR